MVGCDIKLWSQVEDLFEILEVHDSLNTNSNAHIWLLQHLFLDKINANAESWYLTWNQHTLARCGQAHQLLQQLYTHDMITNSIWGIYPENKDEIEDGDYNGYRIDWEDIDQPAIFQHHQAYNLANDEVDDQNSFVVNHFDWLSHIEVPDLQCPFNCTPACKIWTGTTRHTNLFSNWYAFQQTDLDRCA